MSLQRHIVSWLSMDAPPTYVSTLFVFAVLAMTMVGVGCAGGLSNQADIDRDIGRATLRDIVKEVPVMLRRAGYDLYETRRTGRRIYFETGWRTRAPFEDEGERGAKTARTRIIIRASRAERDTYRLVLLAENQVRGVPRSSDFGGMRWSTIPATEMFETYVRELSTAIEMEVDAGVRIH